VLGVPHTEVELILINGESAGFDRFLREGDRVAVYPTFEAFDVTPLLRMRDHPLRVTRFVADVHLGGLAHLLRMTGFDTLFDTEFEDSAIAAIAARDHRIVLTRDCELLKRPDITHGCFVHAHKSALQLREIFERLDLARSARPFTLRRTAAWRRPISGAATCACASLRLLRAVLHLRWLWTYLLGTLALATHAGPA
jgi:hypothetical protein